MSPFSGYPPPMLRTILIYGVLLAAGALGLQWLQYRFLIQTHSAEVYVALVALAFLGVGIWVGARLFRRPPPAPFAVNTAAQRTLGISGRELEVLELLAAGRSNKEIAGRLDVSPNPDVCVPCSARDLRAHNRGVRPRLAETS